MSILALFVGSVIGPGLLVLDHDRPYRGILVIAICAVLVVHGIHAQVSRRRQSTP